MYGTLNQFRKMDLMKYSIFYYSTFSGPSQTAMPFLLCGSSWGSSTFLVYLPFCLTSIYIYHQTGCIRPFSWSWRHQQSLLADILRAFHTSIRPLVIFMPAEPTGKSYTVQSEYRLYACLWKMLEALLNYVAWSIYSSLTVIPLIKTQYLSAYSQHSHPNII